MGYKRGIPLIVPLLIWISGQIFLRWPQLIYASLIIATLLIITGVKLLAGRGRKDWLLLSIAPILFFWAFSSYIAIIIGDWLIQLLLILIFWFLFVYLKNLYYYFTRKESESVFESKLDNLLIAGSFLTVFAAATVLFSLSIFINWQVWLTVVILAITIGLLFVQFTPLKKVRAGRAKVLIGVSVLALAELTWALSWLPLKFHLLGLFMAISFYLALIIIRLHLRGTLAWRALKLPLLLSAAAFIILVLTARWF